MPEQQSPKREAPSSRSFRSLFLSQLPLERETSFFILANVLDFFMTYLLLWTGHFKESNPFAAYFLNHWGPIKGMLLFKLCLVTFVCLIAQIVAVKQLRSARFLLLLSTAITAGVVLYSLVLLLQIEGFLPGWHPPAPTLMDEFDL
ncbi:DUF5658 family protein [Planctomicrobium sp. SH664]|uniref:DUF5658 family protein n=1 Tax=Planctomicrobium sp. SH664 TaxID=3448125 RepID=UPI003F5BF558